MKRAPSLLALFALLASSPAVTVPFAFAADGARTTAEADHRIRVLPYDEFAVTSVDANIGFQIVIEFEPSERIENVSIGDGAPWQITPNRRSTALFVKPLAIGATNMTVLTTARRYVFDLRAIERPSSPKLAETYVVRFSYPAPARPTPPPPPPTPPAPAPVINTAYATKGAKAIAPVRIWDDGKFTHLEFPVGMELPVIAQIGADGTEGLVNFRFEGRTMIIDGVAERFVLRQGRKALQIENLQRRIPSGPENSARTVSRRP